MSYFRPESTLFQDTYGGWIDYQITGIVPLYRGENFAARGIHFWWAGDYFSRKGTTTGLGTTTRIEMEMLTAGLKYVYPESIIRPYAGAGLKYYFLRVNNYTSVVQREMTRNGPGGVFEVGSLFFVSKHCLLDLFASYSIKSFSAPSSSRSNVETASLNVGGLNIGLGLGTWF